MPAARSCAQLSMELAQVGKYKIVGRIGQGAMGEVYKAQDPVLNRFVAVKTISASLGSDEQHRKRRIGLATRYAAAARSDCEELLCDR